MCATTPELNGFALTSFRAVLLPSLKLFFHKELELSSREGTVWKKN
jgi:hypothetical protein